MTACPTRFVRSVCQTPITPVTIGIATIPATRAVRRPSSTVACPVSGSTWIAVSSTARRRNGEMTPSPAEMTIRPQTSARRGRYGPNSRMILQRFALRTAGSAGRSGASPVTKAAKRRPGTRLSVPDGSFRPAAARLRGAERRDRLSETLGQLARRRNRRARSLDDDRRADHDLHAGAAREPRARPEDRVCPDDRDRQERRGGGERKARSTARPRPVGRPEHRPLREDRDGRSLLERACGRGDRADVPAAALDRDPAETVECPAAEADPPQLSLREEAELPLERGGEEEGIRERVVVRDDDHPPRRNARRAVDLEPPDGADRRRQDHMEDAIEAHPPGQSRIARAVSSARCAYPSGVPCTRSPASSWPSSPTNAAHSTSRTLECAERASSSARLKPVRGVPSRTTVAHTRHRRGPTMATASFTSLRKSGADPSASFVPRLTTTTGASRPPSDRSSSRPPCAR